MRVANVLKESLQDGKGCNLVVFTQGCNIRCPGCHNKELWDIHGGKEWSVQDILSHITDVTTGLTVSGGEPTMQYTEVKALLWAAKKFGLTTTLYTGMTKEQWDAWKRRSNIAQYCDYIKIGPFVEELKDTSKGMTGSSNQKMYRVEHSYGKYPKLIEI